MSQATATARSCLDQRQRRLESGQRAPVVAVVDGLSPVDAVERRELLVGSPGDDDVVGDLRGGESAPVEQRTSAGLGGGLVAAQAPAESAGEDDDGERFAHALSLGCGLEANRGLAIT